MLPGPLFFQQKRMRSGELKLEPYVHKVQYYETDKMGIVHHANYIHWMEEARIDFLDQLGWNFDKLEEQGVSSPVLALRCSYKKPTRFPERVTVRVFLTAYRGVRMTIAYRMENEAGETVFEGESDHCFLDASGMPARLRRVLPGFDEALTALLEPKD